MYVHFMLGDNPMYELSSQIDFVPSVGMIIDLGHAAVICEVSSVFYRLSEKRLYVSLSPRGNWHDEYTHRDLIKAGWTRS